MADAVTAAAAPLLPGLPDEVVVWEILARLPPKSLLRCHAVCPAWRRTTSTRRFLLAHHCRQPSLPVVFGYQKNLGYHKNILAFDHRSGDARLQPVARLDNANCFCLDASCDGLVILSTRSATSRRFSVCNPATRQLALLRQLPASILFSVLGMYLHRPSGEYRLLLYRTSDRVPMIFVDPPPEGKIGCYILALGSEQSPRYIEGSEEAPALCFDRPAVLGDSLHWSPVKHQSGSTLVTVFDTTAESFRPMPAPVAPTKSYIFEMDGTLAIYNYNGAMEIVDIWVLPNYQADVWDWEYKYQVELPVAEIRGQLGKVEGSWHVSVVSADGDVLLLVSYGQWLFYVDIGGKLVESFHRDDQQLSSSRLLLKQTLVPHTFFTALEDYAVNASPFI